MIDNSSGGNFLKNLFFTLSCLFLLLAAAKSSAAQSTTVHCDIVRFDLLHGTAPKVLFSKNVTLAEESRNNAEVELYRDNLAIYKVDITQHDSQFGTGDSYLALYIYKRSTNQILGKSVIFWPEQSHEENLAGIKSAELELAGKNPRFTTRITCDSKLQ